MDEEMGIGPERLDHLLRGFSRQRVLVVGDMVADEYLFGTPVRISREAPVVILEFSRRELVPGGATNVAVNLRDLGAKVDVVGVIGADATGMELRQTLAYRGIGVEGLVTAPERPTSTKTRIVGGGVQVVQQQIVRLDRIVSDPMSSDCRDRLLRAAETACLAADGLILSDYEHGVLDPQVSGACLSTPRHARMVTTVDAHGDLFRFQGMTLATPNQPEAEATLGRTLGSPDKLEQACRDLLLGMDAQGVLITRGSQGLVALDRARHFTVLPALNMAEVRDATGAGDTVAAAATLVLGAGGTLAEAAAIGNMAASLVVRRFGAATVTTEGLAAAFRAAASAGG
jgi:rfaE bifunctional protein kinase chain/domain